VGLAVLCASAESGLLVALASPRRVEELAEAGGTPVEIAARVLDVLVAFWLHARARPSHSERGRCQRSLVSNDGTTARIGGKRSVERLGKVAGGILLAVGSVGGVPAIGQMIGSDDDKPVVMVVQQDQSAGQERPADQPTVGVQALGPV
jgi:hypothetical protein